nr:hypothetical protein [Bacteroidota bacterium]
MAIKSLDNIFKPERITFISQPGAVCTTVLDDPNVDAVLAIFVPQAVTDPTDTAIEVCKFAGSTSKSIIAAWAGGQSMHKGRQIFSNNDIAVFHTPEQAVRAFMTPVSYTRNLKILYETPKDIPVEFKLERKKLREKFEVEYFKRVGIEMHRCRNNRRQQTYDRNI